MAIPVRELSTKSGAGDGQSQAILA
jgi:hypothetical protein